MKSEPSIDQIQSFELLRKRPGYIHRTLLVNGRSETRALKRTRLYVKQNNVHARIEAFGAVA